MINKGFGAGGFNTTLNGSNFENKTSIVQTLINHNFKKVNLNKTKFGYYYELIHNNIKIVYTSQSGFSTYCKKIFNISCYKHPDEAFIIFRDNKIYIKILEKKNQNCAGSVEDKLKTGKFIKREYEIIFNNSKFIFSFAFCVSKFLQNNFTSNKIKYIIIKQILLEDNILLFYGDDLDYFDKIYNWIFIN